MLPEVAETAARIALQLRDSGQGHASLAEAFAKRGEAEKGVLEACSWLDKNGVLNPTGPQHGLARLSSWLLYGHVLF